MQFSHQRKVIIDAFVQELVDKTSKITDQDVKKLEKDISEALHKKSKPQSTILKNINYTELLLNIFLLCKFFPSFLAGSNQKNDFNNKREDNESRSFETNETLPSLNKIEIPEGNFFSLNFSQKLSFFSSY